MNDHIPNPVSDVDGEQWKHSPAGLRARAATAARLGGSPRRGAFRWLAPGLAVALIAATIVWLQTEPISPVAGGCPVTASGATPFTPPAGLPSEPWIAGEQWYGSTDLWTIIAADGGYTPRMTAWWSVAFPGDDEETPPLDVTARRLDAPGTVESRGTARAYSQGAEWFMKADLAVLPPGCWEVTGTYKGATLSFVVDVSESDEPVAGDCPVTAPEATPFTPPTGRSVPPQETQIWYGNDRLWTVLDTDGGYRERKSVWWSVDFPGGIVEGRPPIMVSARQLDGAGLIQYPQPGTNAYTVEDGWLMIAAFPTALPPGCWEVTGTYKDATLSFVVEVAAPDGTCPVTAPDGPSFVPPSPWPAVPPDLYQSHWYGTEDLWMMAPFEGVTIHAPGDKLFFWSRHFSIGSEDFAKGPDLTVTLRWLDATAEPIVITGAGNGTHDDLGTFMIAGSPEIPIGCWLVTAEYRGATLIYVARVAEG